MVEYYKEKVKTNLELLKIVASGVTVFIVILGNLLLKDNFGNNIIHYILFVTLVFVIFNLSIIGLRIYDSILININKLKNG